MNKRELLFCVFALGAAASLHSQERERILLPIATNLPGAYGSFWVTRFTVVNGLDRPLVQNEDAGPFGGCLFPGVCETPPVPSNTAFEPVLYSSSSPQVHRPGAVIYARRAIADRLHFSLRVQDTSRQAFTWGTEIPVVRERQLRTGKIVLPNVPLDGRFRQSLRVYEVDDTTAACDRVMVRVFDQQSGATLGARELELRGLNDGPCNASSPEYVPDFPNYAQIHGIGQLLTGSTPDVVGVEITPVTSFRFWAFISVTNNETQHVTTITPQ
ncbi:MAG TPA: hypothetical protein VFF17_04590 [Thermoanaerobaculia bacterium]|nr:hypothetical protein [Thermoanaerobaculia bacterium]